MPSPSSSCAWAPVDQALATDRTLLNRRRSYAGAVAKTDDAVASATSAALDELDGVDPSEFVAVRKRLVAELRAAGDGDAAKEVGTARRPTNAAWALNQLARADDGVLTAFLAGSRHLATAQQAALAGDRDALRTATRARPSADDGGGRDRSRLPRAGCVGDDAHPDPDHTGSRDPDPATAEALGVGRLTREADVASGFTTDFELPPTRGAAVPKARPKLQLVPDQDDVRRRRTELEAAITAAEAEVEEASAALTAAEQSTASAEERIAQLTDELADAQRDRRDAAKDLRERAEDREQCRHPARPASPGVE